MGLLPVQALCVVRSLVVLASKTVTEGIYMRVLPTATLHSGYVHMLLSGTAKSRVVQHNWDRDSVHTAEQDLNGRTPMPKQISVFDQSRLARMFQLIQSFLNGSCSRRDPGSNPGIRFCLVLVGRTFVSESKEKNPQVPYSMQSEKASLQVYGA